MNQYSFGDLFTVLGIVVSIASFAIGYRKSIGARRERAKAANADLRRTLLRLVVIEGYDPAPEELEILAEGFAIEHDIKASQIDSPATLLNVLYTQVAGSDLIEIGQRSKIFERTKAMMSQVEKFERAVEFETFPQWRHLGPFVPTLIKLLGLSSLLGAIVAILPRLRAILNSGLSSKNQELHLAIVAFVVILVLMFTTTSFAYLFWFYDASEDDDPRRAWLTFEKNVLQTIHGYGLEVAKGPKDRDFDASIHVSGRRILLEIKYLAHYQPMIVRQISERLGHAVEREGAAEGWIVVNDLPKNRIPPTHGKITIFSLEELQKRLKEAKTRGRGGSSVSAIS